MRDNCAGRVHLCMCDRCVARADGRFHSNSNRPHLANDILNLKHPCVCPVRPPKNLLTYFTNLKPKQVASVRCCRRSIRRKNHLELAMSCVVSSLCVCCVHWNWFILIRNFSCPLSYVVFNLRSAFDSKHIFSSPRVLECSKPSMRCDTGARARRSMTNRNCSVS